MDQEKVNRTDEIEIDLRELFYLLKQKLLIVVAAFVIGGILAGAATYVLIKPTYRASSLLYVVSASNNSVVNLADLQIGTNLTADYEELLLSRPMMESVIQNLNLTGVSANSLRGMLSITNKSGTRILQISATTRDPQLSADIANEVANLAAGRDGVQRAPRGGGGHSADPPGRPQLHAQCHPRRIGALPVDLRCVCGAVPL